MTTGQDITQRNNPQEPLRKSEERFRLMADHAPLMVWMSGVDRRCSWFNKPWLHFAGRTMEQELGDGWTERVHPDDLNYCLQTYFDHFESRQPFTMEYRLRQHDGQYRWIVDSGMPRFDADESFTGYIGSCIDITEHKSTEQALRTSLAHQATEAAALARLNSASARLWSTHDLRQGLDEMLAATIELLQADRGNVHILDTDAGVLRLVTQRGFEDDFIDIFGEVTDEDGLACARALRSGERIVIDVEADADYEPYRAVARAADYRSVQSTPLIGSDGAVLGMLSTHWRLAHRPSEQDLRRLDLYARQAANFIERCRVADALRNRKQQLRAIFNTVADAIITIDQRGNIVDLNHATLRLFGYAREELLGENVKILMPSPFREVHDQYIENYLRTGKATIIGIGREVVARRKDSSTFPAELAVSEFEGEKGRMFTGTIRDVTGRKEMERHLAQSRLDEQQRIAQELHDGVGGLMTGISMIAKTVHVELRRTGSPQADVMAEVLGHIHDAHEQLRQVAHGLVPVEMTPHGLQEALEELATRNTSSKVQCTVLIGEPVLVKDGNVATQLFFIAQESVSNALRHSGASQVAIGLSSLNNLGQLTIRDNGKGFGASPDSFKGMGLRTMRYRATLIGATLTVASAPGQGTTVTCQFHMEAADERD